MSECGERLVRKWRLAAPGSTHAIDKDMVCVTFDVISETMLGGCSDDFRQIIAEGAARYFSGATWAYLFALLNLPSWLPRRGRHAMESERSRLRHVVGSIVRDRRAMPRKANDLLSRLMSAGHPETGDTMSDEQLVDNLLTFLIAGHDTTAKALTWTLYLVSKSPEWEFRMLEEINRVVPDGPISGAHVDKLAIVQQVFKEGMRLYPSFPETSRVAARDVELGGELIRAGTFIDIPIYAIHRHRRLWDDPDRFDPRRFAPENTAKHSRYQFIPFGGGPRVCIGASFAMTEGAALLATFVRAARFTCPPGFKPRPEARLSLAPKGGMCLNITMRD
jgi:cytochrome P450